MTIQALHNTILFQFVDAVSTSNQFVKGTTASGIILAGDTFDSSAKTSRWIDVIAVGPSVTAVKVGDQALLPALRWTEGLKHDGIKFWKTDELEVVAVRNHPTADIRPLGNWVLFTQQPAKAVRQVGLIAVIGGVDETPRGKSFAAGPKADAGLAAATFCYSTVNFTDTVQHDGIEIAFIKEKNVLLILEP